MRHVVIRLDNDIEVWVYHAHIDVVDSISGEIRGTLDFPAVLVARGKLP